MPDQTNALLEEILTSQVLILASQIRAEKKAKGVTSTSDFVYDAVRLIQEKRESVIQALSSVRRT